MTIQGISIRETNCVIQWIVIYPVDSVINLLNNCCLLGIEWPRNISSTVLSGLDVCKAKNTRQFMRFRTKRIIMGGVCLISPFFSLLVRRFALRCYGVPSVGL